MLVKDLKIRTGFDELVLEIVSKKDVRTFTNYRGSGKVCNAVGLDEEKNEVSVTLWNEQCSEVNEGDKIKITNGWVSEFQGNMQVSTGRNGKLEVLKE